MITEDAVVFLGHGAVVAAQPGLDMNQQRVGGVGRECPSQSRGGVALHDHYIRPGFPQGGIERTGPTTELTALAVYAADPNAVRHNGELAVHEVCSGPQLQRIPMDFGESPYFCLSVPDECLSVPDGSAVLLGMEDGQANTWSLTDGTVRWEAAEPRTFDISHNELGIQASIHRWFWVTVRWREDEMPS